MNYFTSIVISAAFLFFGFKASGQACCSGGVPLGGSLGLGTANSKTLQLTLTHDYNSMKDLVNDSYLLEDDTRSRSTHSSILEINYGLNNRFSLTGVLPVIKQTRTIKGFNGNIEKTETQGIGDILFLVKYRILNPAFNLKSEWIIGGGPKLPTAKTNFTNNQGLALVADMQPGSGSFDWFIWSYYTTKGISGSNFGVTVITSYRHSGENKNYTITQTYRFGNEFQVGAGTDYSFFIKWPVKVFYTLRYRLQTDDIIDQFIFPSTGGKWLHSVPGINIDFTPQLSMRFSGEIPIYRKLNGTQLTTSHKLTAAISYTIPFNKNELTIF